MEQISRITTKGQMVIPKRFRDLKGIRIGDSITLESHGDNVHVARRSGWARATAGSLPSPHGPIEPEELEEVLERTADEEIIERYRDTR